MPAPVARPAAEIAEPPPFWRNVKRRSGFHTEEFVEPSADQRSRWASENFCGVADDFRDRHVASGLVGAAAGHPKRAGQHGFGIGKSGGGSLQLRFELAPSRAKSIGAHNALPPARILAIRHHRQQTWPIR
jgi:hypothetical protein